MAQLDEAHRARIENLEEAVRAHGRLARHHQLVQVVALAYTPLGFLEAWRDVDEALVMLGEGAVASASSRFIQYVFPAPITVSMTVTFIPFSFAFV